MMRDTDVGVLVADADVAMRTALRGLLEEAGYVVVEASGGGMALRLLRSSERPLVALLSMAMPGLDGVGVLTMVAQDDQLAPRHTYVLMSAGEHTLVSLSTATLVAQLGGLILPQPFEPESVLRMVAKAANRLANRLAHSPFALAHHEGEQHVSP